MALGLTASYRNYYQESSCGVKCGRHVRLITSPPSVPCLPDYAVSKPKILYTNESVGLSSDPILRNITTHNDTYITFPRWFLNKYVDATEKQASKKKAGGRERERGR
jgi:hypothetical protein